MMEDYTITLEDAQAYCAAWKQSQDETLAAMSPAPEVVPAPLAVKAFTFDLSEMKQFINRVDAFNAATPVEPINAIRFYAGIKEDLSPTLIYVAVTEFDGAEMEGGNDIAELPASGGDSSGIYDFSFPCPMTCANGGNSILD